METASFIRAFRLGEELPELPVVAFQVPEHFAGQLIVDDGFVDAAHAAGIAVHVWTVNEADDMARLIELGVDGLISDRPSLLSELLGGRAWRPTGTGRGC